MGVEDLDLNFDGRTAVLGIGNEQRGDDAAGVRVGKILLEEVDSEHVLVINGASVPEKFTSEIREFNPDQILLLDTVDFGEKAGLVSIVDPEKIQRDFLSSHRLSLDMLIDYLEEETGADIYLIGIQPGQIDREAQMSEEVKKSVESLSEFLIERLK